MEDLHPAVADVAATLHSISTTEYPDGGLCLAATACLGYTAHTAGATAAVVCGTYAGKPHWWLECDGWRVDPTLHQFGHPGGYVTLVEGEGALPAYRAGVVYPNGYTGVDIVQAEAMCAFAYPAAAYGFVRRVLGGVAG